MNPADTPALFDRERVRPRSRAEWRAWLEHNHADSPGVWVIRPRRAGSDSTDTLTYDELVEEALCFGWVDGRVQTVDDDFRMQMVTPRRPTSTWARTNKARVERLEAAGLMTPAGLRVIEVAKANGSWTLLEEAESGIVPDDLTSALAADDAASTHWESFLPSIRQQVVFWVTSAKRSETRERRIAETVRLSAEGTRPR